MENKPEKKKVHDDHRKRVRENVLKNGLSQLEDHRLLELLLFYSIPRKDTNELAHHILEDEFDESWCELLKGDLDRFKRIFGVGENTALLLSVVGEIHRRASKPTGVKKRYYKTADDYISLAKERLEGEAVEKVYILCFDNAGKLKKSVQLSSGSEVSALLDVRKAVQTVMDCDGVKAVLCHNHPTGNCEPSAGDIDTTRSLCVMFRKLGFFLVDHIIIGENGDAFSMYSDPQFKGMFY